VTNSTAKLLLETVRKIQLVKSLIDLLNFTENAIEVALGVPYRYSSVKFSISV
jgi:hypothetical protein